MAHKLGLKVIAEGIETEAQLALLKQAGCDYGQGFLFSAALPSQDFEAILMADRAGRAGWRGLF
jgi:EAL domain-containing protein (putative c-di-GMP-specific phosphodiesterase class I)